MSKLLELFLITWLSISIFLGAVIFSKGFLLNRQVISNKSQLCIPSSLPYYDEDSDKVDKRKQQIGSSLGSMVDWCRSHEFQKQNIGERQPIFSKIILILVDALRYDFIPRMKFLSNTISFANLSGNSVHSFRFIADPPTTTMQRLKALMTGTMPTFIDASANFNSYEVEEDNIIYQLHAAGKRIAFLGDDTWLSLFPKYLFTSPFVEAHPSFNAWDLDTVDRLVNTSLHRILQSSEQKQWDALIAHFLGVDHCGHRYGPRHPEMQRKLNESDAALEYIFNNMTPDTLLIVFGDHGMTKTGDHGGDSSEEIESGLVFLSKIKMSTTTSFPLTKSGRTTESSSAVSQIDLAPTISSIFGLPIPFSSIGQIIPDIMDTQFYSNALASNVAQVSRYIDFYSTVSNLNANDKKILKDTYNKVEEAFHHQLITESSSSSGRTKFNQQAQIYLKLVKKIAVNTWTQFDFVSIYIGIFDCLISLVLFLIFLTVIHISYRRSIWILCIFFCTFSSLSVIWFLTKLEIRIYIICCILIVLSLIGFIILKISNNVKAPIQSESEKVQLELEFPEFSEIIAIIAYLLTCLVVFSNSFVINEGYVLGFVLLVISLIQVLTSRIQWSSTTTTSGIKDFRFQLSLTKEMYKSSWISFFMLSLIIRLGNLFFRCREELIDCQEEFLLHKHLPSLPEDWVVHKYFRYGEALLSLAVLVVSFRHHMMTRKCIASSRPAAFISKYIPSVLVVLVCVHWALQGLPFGLPQIAQSRLLNYFPSVLQSVTILSLFIVWVKPICCIGRARTIPNENLIYHKQLKKSKRNSQSTINNLSSYTTSSRLRVNGSVKYTEEETELEQLIMSMNSNNTSNFENGNNTNVIVTQQPQLDKLSEDVFSSSIMANGILVTLLSVQVSSAGVTPIITLIPYSIVCLLNISSQGPRHKIGSWSSIICWTLASQYFFYATGHQAVFSAIPWDSAFIGTSDALGNIDDTWLSWIRPALAVLGNLHVSQIIFSVSLPLLSYWRGEVDGTPETFMGKKELQAVYTLGGKFILLHGVKLITCICCATLHRRHLMVWKIFAPKFIFEGISFLIIIIVVPSTLIFITRLNYLFHNILIHERQVIVGQSNNP